MFAAKHLVQVGLDDHAGGPVASELLKLTGEAPPLVDHRADEVGQALALYGDLVFQALHGVVAGIELPGNRGAREAPRLLLTGVDYDPEGDRAFLYPHGGFSPSKASPGTVSNRSK